MKSKKRFLVAFLFVVLIITSIPTNTITATAASNDLTVADMPASLKTSIEWVYTNRMVKEGTPSFKNLIFDQIYDGNGTLNIVVRWQSSKNVTLAQRQNIASMISRQINNWTQYLNGYDGWAYDKVTVNVVGWACADASQILDKQPNEVVYTDYITDEVSKTDSAIPSKLPCAPDTLSRAIHYSDSNYAYPGTRFDEYLWATSNWNGGCGGDWGQRVSDDYILATLDSNEVQIIEHEIGHGFGLPDFYEDADRPPAGFPTTTIMWAGDSATITSWDIWMLRYTWSQIKNDTSRFPAVSSTTTPTVAPTVKPTATPTVKPTVTPTIVPTITPTAIPTTSPSGTLQLTTETSSWSNGYTMNVHIKNTSNSSVNDWKLIVKKSDFNITNIWCAEVTDSGDTYIITPLSWNKTISAGGTVNFGLQSIGSPVTDFTYELK